MAFEINQQVYNESPMYFLLEQVMQDNNINALGVDSINSELLNQYFFNSEHSLQGLRKPNKYFYSFLKNITKKYGNYSIVVKDLNNIQSSLIFNDITDLNIKDCNIGINESINTYDKDFVCLKFDNVRNTRIKNSSFDYPLYFVMSTGEYIELENCVLDSLFIDHCAKSHIYINECYINNLYILGSHLTGGIHNNTIKHLYINNSNCNFISRISDDYTKIFDNIYCDKSIIEVVNSDSIPVEEEIIDVAEHYKKKETNTTFYTGDIEEFDQNLITKLNSLDFYSSWDTVYD